MSKQVDYNPVISIRTIGDTYDPTETSSYILNGYIPANFVQLSKASKAFKELVLAEVLLNVNDRDALLTTVSNWVRASQPETQQLQVLSEYAAAIAFAFDEKELAVNIITRNKPASISKSVWTIIGAIKKGMPGLLYQGLVTGNKSNAEVEWNNTKDYVISTINSVTP